MAILEVPLIANPQRFSIQLNGVGYVFVVKWNTADDAGWILDIQDENNVPLVGGIPLVTGADLLAQYGYLGFTGQLQVQTDFDLDAVPTFDNLGDTSHLYFVTA